MTGSAARIRVLCVDDHRIVREGIALILSREPDMDVVARAASGEEAIAMFARHRPDITLMDLRLKAMSGPEAISEIRRRDPNARIIVLTMYDGDEDIHRALAAGATTYLLKEALPDELVRTVRDVYAGREHSLHDGVKAKLDERAAQPALTPREIEVIELISRGMRNKVIATQLGITETTVAVHIKNIFAKLKVNERTAAVHVAVRRGIVHIE
jgi:two-component system NarL family response regulator